MYLKCFSYKANGWELDVASFNQQTLVAGTNATGKTKMQKALFRIIDTMLNNPQKDIWEQDFIAVLSFETKQGVLLHYSLNIKNGRFVEETFMREEDGYIFANRNKESCSFYGEDGISLPDNMSVLQAKTDLLKYSEAASVLEWAKSSRFISFSSLTSAFPLKKEGGLSMEEMHTTLEKGEIDKIKTYLHELDYHVEDLDIYIVGENIKILFIKEFGIKKQIYTFEMSNGLFRTLYILYYMLYVSKQNVKFIVIDDLGEGLDYNRSTKLGKLVFGFCKEHDIQLIAASNDNFLMNVVDLENWLILCRTESKVDSISSQTHKALFDKFRKTGLRNFDIFRTDFIERHKDDK